MLALALHDEAFEASTMQKVDQIFQAEVPPHKNSRTLHWKEDMLDVPVFRQPIRSEDGTRKTSPIEPLRSSTSYDYFKRLGLLTGFEHSLTHYCIRRGTGNAVDDVATAAERDQIMGHAHSGVFQFYLNQRVKCDVQAAFLGRPSEKALLRAVGQMSLTADPRAPTRLNAGQSSELATNQIIVKLTKKRDALTAAIKQSRSLPDAKLAILWEKKKEANSALKAEKTKLRHYLKAKSRKEYFRNIDTRELEAQFIDPAPRKPSSDGLTPDVIVHKLKERVRVAKILCYLPTDLTEHENLVRRIKLIRNMTRLCRRREAQRRTTDCRI
jgi:hypothetical protein